MFITLSLIIKLLQEREVETAKISTTTQVDDRGLARIEEVFIKELFIF
jgi:hypothetical protein